MSTPRIKELLDELISLKNDFYYKDGDIIDSEEPIFYIGVITGGATVIDWSMDVDKKLDNISKITVENLTVAIRHSDGGYIGSDGFDPQTLGTLTLSVATSHKIFCRLTLNKSVAFTNNCPVSIRIYKCKLKLNK